jgi:hypothetical protein
MMPLTVLPPLIGGDPQERGHLAVHFVATFYVAQVNVLPPLIGDPQERGHLAIHFVATLYVAQVNVLPPLIGEVFQQKLVLQIEQAAQRNGAWQIPRHIFQLPPTQKRLAADVRNQIVAVGVSFGNQIAQGRIDAGRLFLARRSYDFDGLELFQLQRDDVTSLGLFHKTSAGSLVEAVADTIGHMFLFQCLLISHSQLLDQRGGLQ